jgi:hypothetical protein
MSLPLQTALKTMQHDDSGINLCPNIKDTYLKYGSVFGIQPAPYSVTAVSITDTFELCCSVYCFVSIICCSMYCLFVLFYVLFCVDNVLFYVLLVCVVLCIVFV